MDDLQVYDPFNTDKSYRAYEKMTMKGCLQWHPVYDLKDFRFNGIQHWSQVQ